MALRRTFSLRLEGKGNVARYRPGVAQMVPES
jgi:hypothetical protein